MVPRIRKAGARIQRAAHVWVLGLLLAGCGPSVFPIQPNVPAPVVEPMPAPIGVYYADALRDHGCTGGEGTLDHGWAVAMGPPSIAMFDGLFAAMFRETETVDTWPGATPAPRHVIEVRLREFDGCDARPPIVGAAIVRVGYEAILWSAQGRELTRWRGRGQAGPRDSQDEYVAGFPKLHEILTGSYTPEAAYLAALTSMAMRKAAADFVLSFEGNSVVQARLSE